MIYVINANVSQMILVNVTNPSDTHTHTLATHCLKSRLLGELTGATFALVAQLATQLKLN